MKNTLLIILVLFSIISCSKKIIPIETDAQRCARLFPTTIKDSSVKITFDTTFNVSLDTTYKVTFDTVYNDTSKTIIKNIETKVYIPKIIIKNIETSYTIIDSAGNQSFRDSITKLNIQFNKVKKENNELQIDNKVNDKKYKTLFWCFVFIVLLGAFLIYFLNRRKNG